MPSCLLFLPIRESYIQLFDAIWVQREHSPISRNILSHLSNNNAHQISLWPISRSPARSWEVTALAANRDQLGNESRSIQPRVQKNATSSKKLSVRQLQKTVNSMYQILHQVHISCSRFKRDSTICSFLSHFLFLGSPFGCWSTLQAF